MVKEICVQELIGYLDEHFNENVLIKVFSEEKHAKDFENGRLCMGTVEYYRHMYEDDGRGDKEDSMATFDCTVRLSDEKGTRTVPAVQKEILTSIIFCLMEYDHSRNSEKLLKEYFEQKDNLGSYLCIIKDRNSFSEQMNTVVFKEVIDGDAVTPIIEGKKFSAKKVKYVDKPDSTGFQKRNIKRYRMQQEYRYVLDFKASGLSAVGKGEVKSLLLFKINSTIDCQIFKISNRPDTTN